MSFYSSIISTSVIFATFHHPNNGFMEVHPTSNSPATTTDRPFIASTFNFKNFTGKFNYSTKYPTPTTLGYLLITGIPDEHNATMIFLHGLGDTGIGMDDILKNIRKQYVFMAIICPTAGVIPVTWKGGEKMHAWYDIKDPDHLEEDTKGIENATAYVHGLIEEQIVNKSIPANRVFLGGFSQGANLAIHAALKFPQKLGGVLSFSKMRTQKEMSQPAKPQETPFPILELYGEWDSTYKIDVPLDYKFISKCGHVHGITVSERITLEKFFRKYVS